jgi:hypothetical protein
MPVKSDTTKVGRELERHGLRLTGELRKAWEKNPLIMPDKYNAIVRLLTFFAEQLSALTNQIVLESQNAEPPLVQKAREYIVHHKTGTYFVIGRSKKAACASVFLFLQDIPHKATGLKFIGLR